MKRHRIQSLFALLCLLAIGLPAVAQDTTAIDPERADRMHMKRLSRQMERIDRDTAAAMRTAMREARENDGEANPETKATLLSLRDERDRVMSRMLVLSMRHGWEIPNLAEPKNDKGHLKDDPADEIFGPIDELVRRRFAAEALQIAAVVDLPLVSLALDTD